MKSCRLETINMTYDNNNEKYNPLDGTEAAFQFWPFISLKLRLFLNWTIFMLDSLNISLLSKNE